MRSSVRDDTGGRLERLAHLALCAGVFLLPLVIVPNSSDVFVGPKLAVMVLLSVVAAIAAGTAQILGRPTIPIRVPDWLAMTLALWATAAWVFSVEPETSLFGEPTQRAGLVSYILLVGAFGTARVVVTSTARLIGLIIATSVAASVVCVYGLVQIAGIDPIWVSSPVDRVFAFLGQPNWLAAYLAVAIPVTGSLLFITSRPLIRAVVMASLVAQLAVLIGTMSRAGWIGILAGVLTGTSAALFGSGQGERIKRAMAVILPFLVLAAVATFIFSAASTRQTSDALSHRLLSITETDSFEARQRLALWQVAVAATGDTPWFGTGPDTYAVVFPQYRDSVIEAYYAEHLAQFRPESSHNAYLDLSVGLGIPGLFAFAAVVSLAGIRLGGELQRGGVRGRLSLGLLIALTSHSVAIAFMSIQIVSAWILWTLLGAALTVLDYSEDTGLA